MKKQSFVILAFVFTGLGALHAAKPGSAIIFTVHSAVNDLLLERVAA